MFKTFSLTVIAMFSCFCIREEIRALSLHSELNVWGDLDERQPVRTEPDQSPAQQEPHYTTFGFVLSPHASAVFILPVFIFKSAFRHRYIKLHTGRYMTNHLFISCSTWITFSILILQICWFAITPQLLQPSHYLPLHTGSGTSLSVYSKVFFFY